MKIVSRKNWGAQPPKDPPTKLSLGQVRGMAVHYEGADRSLTAHDKCDDVVRGIQEDHQETRGWDDIAYSFLVCRHGYVYEGRGWGVRTAANGTDDGNACFHAVCYLDDDAPDVKDVTPEALVALSEVIAECRKRGFGSEVKPHRAFKPTSCPGEELTAWVARRGYETPPECDPTGKGVRGPQRGTQGPRTPSWYKRVLRVVDGKRLTKGNDVVNVQRRLKAREDGLYGPNTAAKVRGFQKLHGLTPDGVVGPLTAAKLAEVYG